jgi:hypothetical protein
VRFLKYLAVLGLALGLYVFYYWYFCSYTYRYRITVDVEVDGKVQSGSGISQTQWQLYPAWMVAHGDGWKGWSWGEAPVVDLGQHGVLIAIHNPNTRQKKCNATPHVLLRAPLFAVSKTEPGERPAILNKGTDKMFAVLQAFKSRYTLAAYEFPQFVWLPDRNSRLSAKTICPEDFDSIHKSVGIKNVFVEMTSARPDGSIYKILPWLSQSETDARSDYSLTVGNKETYELIVRDILGDKQ